MTKEPDSRCPGCGMRTITSVEWAAKAKRIAELEAQLVQLKHVETQRDHWRKENLDSMDKAIYWEDEYRYALTQIHQLEDENKRLSKERSAALNVTSRDGLLSSEWVLRAGLAEQEVQKLKEDIRIMIEKAADNKLDGYCELGERAAQAEIERDDYKGRHARVAARLVLADCKISEWEETIGQLTTWTHFYGATLCPSGGVDTYGNGMRNAKQQVERILTEGK